MDAWRPRYKFLYDLMENIFYTAELAALVAAFMAVVLFTI